jgi:predicted nucleic acid-binding protein
VKVVADSSPLIALSKIDQFGLLPKLFNQIVITSQVFTEVVVEGAGLPGAHETAKAPWIEVKRLQSEADLAAAQTQFALGIGELSTLLLSREIKADLVLVDDLGARKLMRLQGLRVQGTLGILEAAFIRKHLSDLRDAYARLLAAGVYLDREFIDSRLRAFGFAPL